MSIGMLALALAAIVQLTPTAYERDIIDNPVREQASTALALKSLDQRELTFLSAELRRQGRHVYVCGRVDYNGRQQRFIRSYTATFAALEYAVSENDGLFRVAWEDACSRSTRVADLAW